MSTPRPLRTAWEETRCAAFPQGVIPGMIPGAEAHRFYYLGVAGAVGALDITNDTTLLKSLSAIRVECQRVDQESNRPEGWRPDAVVGPLPPSVYKSHTLVEQLLTWVQDVRSGEQTVDNLLLSMQAVANDIAKEAGIVPASLVYDPQFGDDRLCVCKHPYERHFDQYDEGEMPGCKYCGCDTFQEYRYMATAPLPLVPEVGRLVIKSCRPAHPGWVTRAAGDGMIVWCDTERRTYTDKHPDLDDLEGLIALNRSLEEVQFLQERLSDVTAARQQI